MWRKEQEKEQESFKKIIEIQIKEENVTKTIVKVIKKSKNLVRDTVRKRTSTVNFNSLISGRAIGGVQVKPRHIKKR